jgi:hypothetical protein
MKGVVQMSQFKHSPLRSDRLAIGVLFAALVAAVTAVAALGAITVDARSRVLSADSVANVSTHPGQPGGDASSPDTYYFPAQFKAPEGELAEPIATF